MNKQINSMKIDDEMVTVNKVSQDVAGWYNIFVNGMKSCHSVPVLKGKFTTGGHTYEIK